MIQLLATIIFFVQSYGVLVLKKKKEKERKKKESNLGKDESGEDETDLQGGKLLK